MHTNAALRQEALRRRIPEHRFNFRFSRSAGPGGQNVNKVNTRVTLRFDLVGDSSLSDAEKRRIQTRLRARVTEDGLLQIVAGEHRTQGANRKAAVDRFFELLAQAIQRPKPRRATAPTTASRKRRIQDKKVRGEQKRLRVRPSPRNVGE